MSEIVKDAEYYADLSVRCLRWSRLHTCKEAADDLEKLADEYAKVANRLAATARAQRPMGGLLSHHDAA